jgi:hypothetical protein
MAIGSNTFWLLVRLQHENSPDMVAVTHPKDARVGMRFVSYEAAVQYRERNGLDECFVCEVRA